MQSLTLLKYCFCLFSHESPLQLCPLFLLSLFFFDPSARLPTPQEVSAVGDEAVSVCCASIKPVFSLIQLNGNFSTLYTPTPLSTCLLQLGSRHAQPRVSLMFAFSFGALAALPRGRFFLRWHHQKKKSLLESCSGIGHQSSFISVLNLEIISFPSST